MKISKVLSILLLILGIIINFATGSNDSQILITGVHAGSGVAVMLAAGILMVQFTSGPQLMALIGILCIIGFNQYAEHVRLALSIGMEVNLDEFIQVTNFFIIAGKVTVLCLITKAAVELLFTLYKLKWEEEKL